MESGNGGNDRNIGGRFGRDGMRFGLNGKGMEWNMVHDTHSGGFQWIPAESGHSCRNGRGSDKYWISEEE